jgi:peptidoglycan hydrolase-like protein with peptidoglycan-binding domain
MDFVKKFVILSFFPLLFSLVASAEQLTFTRNLKIGMIGEDVRQLQIFLNKDNDTKVANTGIGSPGQESTYFGALTQKAVIRYQEKNRESILKPNGLSSGTGFVGPSTIGLLNKMPITESEVQKTTKVTAMATTTSAVSPVSPKVVGSGPNYENITTFVSSIEKIAKQNGFSEDKIALMKEEIYKGVATTTDLKSAFMKIVQEKKKKPPDLIAILLYLQFS